MCDNRMKSWPVPVDETFRQEALLGYDLFGSAPEREYDVITKLVAEVLAMPMCMITIVGEDAQWVKSRYGLDMRATGRELSFCAHTIIGDDALVVSDATRDARFRKNSLVMGEPHIRFYAGAPIITADGARIGALCVLDQQPRTNIDLRILIQMASVIAESFNKRKHSRQLAKLDPSSVTSDPHPPSSVLQRAHRMLEDRKQLAGLFSSGLFADPALLIILELFVAHEEGRRCTVSGLSRASSIPSSSCQRWISRLVKLGLVSLEADSIDQRRTLVMITDAGNRKMSAWLRVSQL